MGQLEEIVDKVGASTEQINTMVGIEDLTGGGDFLGVVLYVGHALAGLLNHVGDL